MLLNAVKRKEKKRMKHSLQIEMIFLEVLKLVNLLVWELPVNENLKRKKKTKSAISTGICDILQF